MSSRRNQQMSRTSQSPSLPAQMASSRITYPANQPQMFQPQLYANVPRLTYPPGMAYVPVSTNSPITFAMQTPQVMHPSANQLTGMSLQMGNSAANMQGSGPAPPSYDEAVGSVTPPPLVPPTSFRNQRNTLEDSQVKINDQSSTGGSSNNNSNRKNKKKHKKKTSGNGELKIVPLNEDMLHAEGVTTAVDKGACDRFSDITSDTTSTFHEDSELMAELQQQLIGELDMIDKKENPCGLLVQIEKSYDYHIPALKNFLEWVAQKPDGIKELVVSQEKNAAVAIFSSAIDFDEIDAFMAEPYVDFCGSKLEFSPINLCSSIIVFTDLGEDKILESINDVCDDIESKIVDNKEADEFVLVSFDMSSQELNKLVNDLQDAGVDAFHLYPYPEDEYMIVSKNSYHIYPCKDDQKSPSDDRSHVLLLGLPDEFDEKQLKMVMKLEKRSGGDSSALLELSAPSGMCYVSYSTPQVANRVFSNSPFKMPKDETVELFALMEPTTVVTSDIASQYFILLSGLPSNVGKDSIMFFINNHTRSPVQDVYFTDDTSGKDMLALVCFSTQVVGTPDLCNLVRVLKSCSDFGDSEVKVWNVHRVSTAQIYDKSYLDDVVQWLKENDIRVSIDTPDNGPVMIKMAKEEDVVKFLSRRSGSSKGEKYLEMPLVPSLKGEQLYTDILSSLLPQSFSMTSLVDDEENLEYMLSKQLEKELCKVLDENGALYDKSQDLIEPNLTLMSGSQFDPVKLFKYWRENIEKCIRGLTNDFRTLDGYDVDKDRWNAIKQLMSKSILIKSIDSSGQNVVLSAVGLSNDMTKFEELLTANEGSSLTQRKISVEVSKANYCRMRLLPEFTAKYASVKMRINAGSVLGTIMIDGPEEVLDEADAYITGFLKQNLYYGKRAYKTVKWHFIKQMKTKVYKYFNKIFKDDGLHVSFLPIKKADKHLLIEVCSDSKETFEKVYKTFDDRIICKKPLKDIHWSKRKGYLQQLASGKLPLLIQESAEASQLKSSSQCELVYVMELEDEVCKILERKFDDKPIPSERMRLKDKTRSIGKPEAKTPRKLLPNSRDSGQNPRRGGAVRKDPQKTGNTPRKQGKETRNKTTRRRTQSSSDSSDTDASSNVSNNEDAEVIRLQAPDQYILFTYAKMFFKSEFLEKNGFEGADLEFKDKSILVRARQKSDNRRLKRLLLETLKKLKRHTVVLRNCSDELFTKDDKHRKTVTQVCNKVKAAYAYNRPIVKLRAIAGKVEIVGSLYCIECVPAEAALIVVGSQPNMEHSSLGRTLARIDPDAHSYLTRLYGAYETESPGRCIEIPSTSQNTLFGRYIVIIADDEMSLYAGLQQAFDKCTRTFVTSLVTNLIGSDVKGLVDKDKSARFLLSALDWYMSQEKTSLKTLHVNENSETNLQYFERKMQSFKLRVTKSKKQESFGSVSVSVCANDRDDVEEVEKCLRNLNFD